MRPMKHCQMSKSEQYMTLQVWVRMSNRRMKVRVAPSARCSILLATHLVEHVNLQKNRNPTTKSWKNSKNSSLWTNSILKPNQSKIKKVKEHLGKKVSLRAKTAMLKLKSTSWIPFVVLRLSKSKSKKLWFAPLVRAVKSNALLRWRLNVWNVRAVAKSKK